MSNGIEPEKTGNGDITLEVERFEDDGKKRSSIDQDKRQSLKKETKVRVQGRFSEALDLHYIYITATGTLILKEEWLFVKKLNERS